MAFEYKNDSFTIFENSYKQKNSQPDYKGHGKIGGREVDISCWAKQARNGDNFFSCAVQDKYVKSVSSVEPEPKYDEQGRELNPNYNPEAAANNDFDDDIPF